MSSKVSSTTQQGWRERPPSSYSIKVDTLSQLETSSLYSDGKYQSRRFSSGAYQWRLTIYPKGNDKDNGSGFISMYVEIDSTNLTSTTPLEVYADIRFFVFNKNKNKYFTIQDVESTGFNALRTMWGFSQVIPLDTFNDRKNGYLFDGDQCEFGVDIMVAHTPSNWEVLSFPKVPFPWKFSWTVKNFSKIKESPHTSEIYTVGAGKWVLKLYPNGYCATPDNKGLSIFLDLADGGKNLKDDEKIYVKANVKVEDPHGSNHLIKQLNGWRCKVYPGSGWPQYVPLATLRNSYLDNKDTLKIEIDFKVVSVTKYSSIV